MHAEKIIGKAGAINHSKSHRTGKGLGVYVAHKSCTIQWGKGNLLKFNSALIEYVMQTVKPTNELGKPDTMWIQQWASYFNFPIEIRTLRPRVINDSLCSYLEMLREMRINKPCQVIDPESFISRSFSPVITHRVDVERNHPHTQSIC